MKKTRLASMFILMLLCVGLAFSLTSCGDIEHTHTPNSAVRENEIAATCAADGSYDEVVYCSECGEEISRTSKTTEKLLHTPSEWIIDTEATCKAEGTKHKECTVCHEVLETGKIDKLTTHTPAEAVRENEVESSCSEVGSYDEVVYCSVCEIELSRVEKEISKKDHTPSGWITDTEATCKAEGSNHKECTVCREVLETGKTDKLTTHTPAEAVRENEVDSSCSELGSYDEVVYCSVCEIELSRIEKEISKKDHTPSGWITDTEATCKAEGAKHKECTVCREVLESGVIALAEHTPIVDSAVEATDTKDGLTEGSHCSFCDKVLVAQQIIPAKLQGTNVKSEQLTVDGDRIYGSVSNTTAIFSFLNDIAVNDSASYIVARDIDCTQTIPSKTTTISVGDNEFYILVSNGNAMKLYTVTVRRLPTYTVSFNTHGGAALDSLTIEEGSTVSAPVSEKAGYRLDGWAVNGEPISFPYIITSDVELEAVFSPIVYDITYKLNGGINAEENPDTYTIETSTITLGASTRDYYDFAGWYDNAEFVGDAITQIALGSIGDVVLYARWTPTVYEIKYNLNGGINAEENPESYTVESDTVILATPARAGYEFIGWFIDAECTESITEISLGSHGKVEIYAKWDSVVYNINYKLNGGANSESNPDAYTIETSTITLGAATRDYYDFAGWYDNGEFEGEAITQIALGSIGDVVLYAKWTPTVYEIKYNLNGGANAEENPESYTVESDTITFANPTRVGYTFKGWFSNEACNESITEILHGSHGKVEVYAKWEIIVYNIDYELNGGVNEEHNPISYTVESDTIILAKPSREGYAFVGWYYDAEYTISIAKIPHGSHGKLEIYAKWEAIFIVSGNSITGLTDYAKTNIIELHIPSAIDGVKITSIGECAFYGCTSLTSVTISDGVTSIGENAFHGCTSLTSVTISDGVTSIGNYAFRDCTWLTNVKIPDSVTSIGHSAFRDCTSITSITIPNSVTSSIGYEMFSGCTSLTSITIPDSVTSIDHFAFYGCTSLTSVTIGNGVTSIGNRAFYGCSSLTSVHIYDIAKWCNIHFETNYTKGNWSNPLYYAENLYLNGELVVELIIPDSITTIREYAFYECKSLTKVTIPNSVTSIEPYAFNWCTNLTSVTIGNGVTSIGSDAFDGCTNLTNVYISNISKWCGILFMGSYSNPLYYADTLYLNGEPVTELVILDSVTSIGSSAFEGYRSLVSITIPDSVTSIGSSAFLGCTSLTSAVISNSVTSIGNSAFYGCASLTSITIPDSVTSIGANAFRDCTSLASITIPDSVTSIGSSAFLGCTSLTSAVFSNSVTSIGDSAFRGCTSLASITIGNGVTSIGEDAFSFCASLTSVHISDIAKWCDISFYDYSANPLVYAYDLYLNGKLVTELVIPNSVTSIGSYAFYGCTSLASITIPDSVTSIGSDAFEYCYKLVEVINKSSLNITAGSSNCGYIGYYTKEVHSGESKIVNIGGYLFYTYDGVNYLLGYVGNETELTLPENYNGENYEIYDYAFYNCTSLTSVTIGNGVTSIGSDAFNGCTNLTSVVIPNSVTIIGTRAFLGCTSLASITIPDSVTSIGSYAFYGCSSLTSVYYNGTEGEWSEISIGSSNSSLTNATRYYYSETEPTEEGNYWHYDENGEITVW
ncbi:MAG: leucine-rich repeat protein [Clostridia bacterium]|nr:leucine-rich repeat protein [Clostridia bacterium]